MKLGSSLRTVAPELTLEHARAVAPQLGITRVTEITRLDSLGLPVFTSIRPDAARGSLCVSSGKGWRSIDAEVGAYMEAIELALAEPRRCIATVSLLTPRGVLDGSTRVDAILDFCPREGAEIDVDAPLACVAAEELYGGASVWIPAEQASLGVQTQAETTSGSVDRISSAA
jgi:ribosomal protein S12 methylthiotransferase accessory factor